MANYTTTRKDYINATNKGKTQSLLKDAALERFNVSILGLGDINTRSVPIQALAAVFDLAGFTLFCKQIEPHLAVPDFMGQFIPWLIDAIKKNSIESKGEGGVFLWHLLPFYVKFMGDGLLVLWNVDGWTPKALDNIIISLHQICDDYETEILDKLKEVTVDPPKRLRCGVARGTVFSIGNSADYVGTCINMAARIQKLPGLTFAFNRRGFSNSNESLKDDYVIKKVSIRGIGEGELIGIRASDFEQMAKSDRAIYNDP